MQSFLQIPTRTQTYLRLGARWGLSYPGLLAGQTLFARITRLIDEKFISTAMKNMRLIYLLILIMKSKSEISQNLYFSKVIFILFLALGQTSLVTYMTSSVNQEHPFFAVQQVTNLFADEKSVSLSDDIHNIETSGMSARTSDEIRKLLKRKKLHSLTRLSPPP